MEPETGSHPKHDGDRQAADEYEADARLSALLKTHGTRHTAPAALTQRIRSEIAQQGQPRTSDHRLSGWGDHWQQVWQRIWHLRWQRMLASWKAVGLGYAGGMASVWMLAHLLGLAGFAPAVSTGLAEEITASHVRSLLAAHLADVASSDQHTVKPWFTGKLDYAPPVKDFAQAGFALTGGRMDYINHHPVAALIYTHRQHVINVFVWPDPQPSAPAQNSSRNGFQINSFASVGMRYWLVSDTASSELDKLVRLLQEANVANAPN